MAGLGTSAGALAVAGIVFARQAQAKQDRVSHLFDTGGMWSPEYKATEQSGQRHQHYATLSVALGVALGGLAAWAGWRR